MADEKNKKDKNDEEENSENSENENSEENEKLVYDNWIDEQKKEVQELISENTSGLKKALKSERENRSDLEKTLKKLAKAEKISPEDLEKVTIKLEAQNQKADFYEQASGEGISNLKLAFIVVVQDDLFDRRGNVDFKELKEAYPELFSGKRSPSGHGGEGNNDQPGGNKSDFNTVLRAGRK